MARTYDHEMVSIYPFSEEDVGTLMQHASECVLMWATQEGWPVGVTQAFVWKDGRIWLTFAAHRHRAAAIRRDDRVSVNVSSASYPRTARRGRPQGAITFKGRARFVADEATREWFYGALSRKLYPDDPDGEAAFRKILDSPLRAILEITPEKQIMYNARLAFAHMAGTAAEEDLGARLSSDAERMNDERARRGLPPR